MEVFPFFAVFFLTLCILSETCTPVQGAWEIQKTCEPTWKLNFLSPASHSPTPYFRFLIGHCLCTIPCKETGLKFLYCLEVNLHRNFWWHVWPGSSHRTTASSCQSFKLPLALLFRWHLFLPSCSLLCYPEQCETEPYDHTAIQGYGLLTVKEWQQFCLGYWVKYQRSPP